MTGKTYLDCQDSIRFGVFQVAWTQETFRESFPSHFLQNVLIETSNVC